MKKLSMAFLALFAGVAVTMGGLNATPILNDSFEEVGPTTYPWGGFDIDVWYNNYTAAEKKCLWEKASGIGLVGDGDNWGGVNAGVPGKFYQEIGTVETGLTYTVTALIGDRNGDSFQKGVFSLYASTINNAAEGVELSSFATLLSSNIVTVADGTPTGDANVYTILLNLTTGTGHAGEILWLEFGAPDSASGKVYFDKIAIVEASSGNLPVWNENPFTASEAVVGVTYDDTLDGTAIDPDGQDTIEYSKKSGVGPAWLTVATNGALGGTPLIGDLGTNTFTVIATDSDGDTEAEMTIHVRTTLPPVWNEDPFTIALARVDKPYTGTLDDNVTDPDGDAMTYSMTGPAWLTVATNGTLSGTPTSGDLGANTFTVIATDIDGATPAELNIEVVNIGNSISINFADDASHAFSGGANIGPLETDSSNWNSTLTAGTGDVNTGTLDDLIDATGATTTADISWSANNAHKNWVDILLGTDEGNLGAGYLDDSTGISITVSNIPYASYRVYGLISSDQARTNAAGFESESPLVNGIWVYDGVTNTTRTSYSSVSITETETGMPWVEGSAYTLGNYWILETSGDLSITITKYLSRASIAGLIIEDTSRPAGPVENLVITGPVAGGMVLSWTGANGKPYGVETNSNLIFGDWKTFMTGIIGDGGDISVTNLIGPDQPLFYRVISEVPE